MQMRSRPATTRVIPALCGTVRSTSIGDDMRAFLDGTLVTDVSTFPNSASLRDLFPTLNGTLKDDSVMTFSELISEVVDAFTNPLELLLNDSSTFVSALDVGLRKIDDFISSKHGLFAHVQLPIVKDHVRQAMVGIVDL